MRLLFVSNLFPDASEPYRGLDNATLLHALVREAGGGLSVDALALRPSLALRKKTWTPREQDQIFHPQFVQTAYAPKIGGLLNHHLMRRTLEKKLRDHPGAPWDAVLCAWLFPDACAVTSCPPLQNLPTVLVAQGSDVHGYLQSLLRRSAILNAVARSKGVITRSADLSRRLADAGADPAKLHPVYNGVDLETFHPPAEPKSGPPTLLFVGNFLPVKNPLRLIDGLSRLREYEGYGDAQLVLAGGGPMESALRQQTAALGLESAVRFAGRQSAAGIAALMREASALWLTSWNEGVPNVVIEAFASGLPVISTDVGGISEVLNAPRLGALVPADDPAAMAQATREILDQGVDTAGIRMHGETFSWSRAARRYLDLLNNEIQRDESTAGMR